MRRIYAIIRDILRHGWWIMILSTAIAAGIAWQMEQSTTPIYWARSQFVVSPNTERIQADADLFRSLDELDTGSLMQTYAHIFSSYSIEETAGEQLNLSPQHLNAYRINTVVRPESNIVLLTVEGPDLGDATLLRDTIGEIGIEYLAELYPVYSVRLLDSERSGRPRNLDSQQNFINLILAGLTIGLVLSGFMTPSIRSWFSEPITATAKMQQAAAEQALKGKPLAVPVTAPEQGGDLSL